MGPFLRKVKTASGATAVQIVVKEGRKNRIVEHLGSAHDEAGLAAACYGHGDVTLVMYDVTNLHFEVEHEDELRKVGYSKERRVDQQNIVGLLVDRHGSPLEIGSREGKKTGIHTIRLIHRGVLFFPCNVLR